jgi:hypothetical protein
MVPIQGHACVRPLEAAHAMHPAFEMSVITLDALLLRTGDKTSHPAMAQSFLPRRGGPLIAPKGPLNGDKIDFARLHLWCNVLSYA